MESYESGFCSPPLWKNRRLSPPKSPSQPLLSHHNYKCISLNSRLQAIVISQFELMEVVKSMPESSYELSLTVPRGESQIGTQVPQLWVPDSDRDLRRRSQEARKVTELRGAQALKTRGWDASENGVPGWFAVQEKEEFGQKMQEEDQQNCPRLSGKGTGGRKGLRLPPIVIAVEQVVEAPAAARIVSEAARSLPKAYNWEQMLPEKLPTPSSSPSKGTNSFTSLKTTSEIDHRIQKCSNTRNV